MKLRNSEEGSFEKIECSPVDRNPADHGGKD